MTVYSTSRYATGRQIAAEDERYEVIKPFIYTNDVVQLDDADIKEIHVVSEGDRIDQLAYKHGGDSALWWVIAEANDIFGFPLFLKPGTRLKIPTEEAFRQARNGQR